MRSKHVACVVNIICDPRIAIHVCTAGIIKFQSLVDVFAVFFLKIINVLHVILLDIIFFFKQIL